MAITSIAPRYPKEQGLSLSFSNLTISHSWQDKITITLNTGARLFSPGIWDERRAERHPLYPVSAHFASPFKAIRVHPSAYLSLSPRPLSPSPADVHSSIFCLIDLLCLVLYLQLRLCIGSEAQSDGSIRFSAGTRHGTVSCSFSSKVWQICPPLICCGFSRIHILR